LTHGAAWRSKRAGEPVAQLVEHETFNLGAVGSNPTGLTMDFSVLDQCPVGQTSAAFGDETQVIAPGDGDHHGGIRPQGTIEYPVRPGLSPRWPYHSPE
jgi:hypothetical protein